MKERSRLDIAMWVLGFSLIGLLAATLIVVAVGTLWNTDAGYRYAGQIAGWANVTSGMLFVLFCLDALTMVSLVMIKVLREDKEEQ